MEGTGQPTRLAQHEGTLAWDQGGCVLACAGGLEGHDHVPVPGGMGYLDPAQQNCSWDMPSESEGNEWGDPDCCSSETMVSGVGQSQGEGGSLPHVGCSWPGISQKVYVTSRTQGPGHLPAHTFPGSPLPTGAGLAAVKL